MTRVREVLRAFDNAALEALASKGLVRRAIKDLEAARPVLVSETDEELVASVEGFQVSIPARGPAAARCGCPSGGTCRHILAVVLEFRQDGAGESTALEVAGRLEPQAGPDPDEQPADEVECASTPRTAGDTRAASAVGPIAEILEMELARLEKWAGRARVRKALERMTDEMVIESCDDRRAVIVFPARQIKVFLINGAGLDGVIVDGPTDDSRADALAAILFYRRHYGAETPGVANPKAAPVRTINTGVVGKVRLLIEEMVGVGLSHMSEAMPERLLNEALATATSDLPRLSLALRTLASETELIIERAAQADELRLMRFLAETHALCRALEQNLEKPRPELTGRGRTAYEERESIEIHCVAAYQWKSKSDYQGVTLVFWDNEAGNWLTWSDARPQFHASGFDPAARYRESAPWGAGVTLDVLARSRVDLSHPRRNYQNRLSSSTETQARLIGPVNPASLDWRDHLCTDWNELARFAGAARPMGLGEVLPNRDLVVLRPRAWGRRAFDPVRQELHWPVEDERGNTILLRVPFSDVNEGSLELLENLSVQGEKIWGVAGRALISGGAPCIYPLSLFGLRPDRPLIHLTLDGRAPSIRSAAFAGNRKKVPQEGCMDDPNGEEWGTLPALMPVEDTLLECAEHGSARLDGKFRDAVAAAASDMERQSLPLIADALQNLARSEPPVAPLLLHAAYLVLLHNQAHVRMGTDKSI